MTKHMTMDQKHKDYLRENCIGYPKEEVDVELQQAKDNYDAVIQKQLKINEARAQLEQRQAELNQEKPNAELAVARI